MNEILPPAWRGLTVTVAHTDRSVNQADPLAILQVPGSRHETLRSNQPRPSGAVRGQGRPHTLVQGPFCRILFQVSKSLKRSFHCLYYQYPPSIPLDFSFSFHTPTAHLRQPNSGSSSIILVLRRYDTHRHEQE